MPRCAVARKRGHLVDWTTQLWVRCTGTRRELARTPWLAGVVGNTDVIGAEFFQRLAVAEGLVVAESRPDDGLLQNGLAAVRGPHFDPTLVHPLIQEFYAHSARFALEIDARWLGVFRWFARIIIWIFARRLKQLNLPLSPVETSEGVESKIERFFAPEGKLVRTAWIRASTKTARPLFVGEYGVADIPNHQGPCVKVIFPLPNGNAIILLRPQNEPNGAMSLQSDGRKFGDPGFYFTVATSATAVTARYVRSMKEHLLVEADDGELRARHAFSIFGFQFLQMHYRIRK